MPENEITKRPKHKKRPKWAKSKRPDKMKKAAELIKNATIFMDVQLHATVYIIQFDIGDREVQYIGRVPNDWLEKDEAFDRIIHNAIVFAANYVK